MSNATRKTRRAQAPREGWKGENRRSTMVPTTDPDYKVKNLEVTAERLRLEREIADTAAAELFPYSAVMECSQAAYSKGWSRGFRLGICVGGAVALLTYAITFATSVLP